ncbi:unnamed protein product [Linum trigynum]|uniref:Uncharacterized protein n=1 Tax=Linum trigynum TaxID=586398 RepID=A0AAV2G5L3_9ROSI
MDHLPRHSEETPLPTLTIGKDAEIKQGAQRQRRNGEHDRPRERPHQEWGNLQNRSSRSTPKLHLPYPKQRNKSIKLDLNKTQHLHQGGMWEEPLRNRDKATKGWKSHRGQENQNRSAKADKGKGNRKSRR